MFTHRLPAPLVACLLALAFAPTAVAQITFRSGVTLPNGGEIVSFANGRLLATNSVTGTAAFHGIQAYTLTASGSLTADGSFDMSSVFGGAANISSVSRMVADARGFGVASVIPTLTGSANLGRIALFNTTTGTIITTLDVDLRWTPIFGQSWALFKV